MSNKPVQAVSSLENHLKIVLSLNLNVKWCFEFVYQYLFQRLLPNVSKRTYILFIKPMSIFNAVFYNRVWSYASIYIQNSFIKISLKFFCCGFYQAKELLQAIQNSQCCWWVTFQLPLFNAGQGFFLNLYDKYLGISISLSRLRLFSQVSIAIILLLRLMPLINEW